MARVQNLSPVGEATVAYFIVWFVTPNSLSPHCGWALEGRIYDGGQKRISVENNPDEPPII